jgi:DNA-binding PadR family transcriptional regulator
VEGGISNMRGDEAWELGEDDERRHRHGGRGRARRVGPGMGRPGWGPGWGPPGFGPWFGGPKFMHGPRVRRGDVRAAALALLAEQPRNGYQIIQEIGERSGGVWRPSPGSVYPALQQLEDEGLVQAETADGGRRSYTLTEAGHAYVAAHPDEVRAPWEVVAGSVGDDAIELRDLFGQLVMAAIQVVRVGDDAQLAQARTILTDARRSLYRILAADDDDDGGGAGPQ